MVYLKMKLSSLHTAATHWRLTNLLQNLSR